MLLASRLFIYRVVYKRSRASNCNDQVGKRREARTGGKTSSLFFRSTRISTPGTPRWTHRQRCIQPKPSAASTDSLTDSWPHLQCIEKRRAAFRSIRAACLVRPDIEFYAVVWPRYVAPRRNANGSGWQRAAGAERVWWARFNF